MRTFRPLQIASVFLFAMNVTSFRLPAAEPTGKIFRAGAAIVDITPRLDVVMAGNFIAEPGSHIHDPLHARCIALDDGEHRLAIVTVESCMIYRETFDEAKRLVQQKTGLPLESMLMAAVHSHSAPASASVFQAEANAEYQKFLIGRLADVVREALFNLHPAKIGWAVGSEPRHIFNRRWKMQPGVINKDPFGGTNDLVRMNPAAGSPELLAPAGPTDPEVPVLAVKSLDGKPIALLANYSLHYVGGVEPGTVSADYFGAFCDRIQELLGADRQQPQFVALLSNGTSGDCNNINFFQHTPPKQPYEQMKLVANDVAKAALEAYRRIEWHDWVPLKSAQKEIRVDVRRPSKDELTDAQAKLAVAEKQADGQLKHRGDIYARETVLMADFPAQVRLIMQAHRIGDLGIVAIPCEVFAEIGLKIKQQSPLKPSFTIELANGYNGYLPTAAQHKLGGYETWRARSSYLEVGADSKVSATVLELLREVK